MNSSTGLATGIAVGMVVSNSQNRDTGTVYEKTCMETKKEKVSGGYLFADYYTEIIDTCKNNEIIASTTKEDITGLGVTSTILGTVFVIIILTSVMLWLSN